MNASGRGFGRYEVRGVAAVLLALFLTLAGTPARSGSVGVPPRAATGDAAASATSTTTPRNGPIVFVRNIRNGETDVGAIQPSGSGRINLTSTARNELYVDVSPDGRRAAYTRFTPDGGEIYTVSTTGGASRRLTNDAVHDELPIWSPDGRRIAFVRYPGAGDAEVFVMDANGENRRRVTSNAAEDTDPRWSPDGTRLIVHRGNVDENGQDVVVVTLASGAERKLTRSGVNDAWAEWSPDGQRVVYGSFRNDQWDLYAVQVSDLSTRRLTTDPADDWAPRWSHGGTHLLFMRGRLEGTAPPDEVYVMSADGSSQRSVSPPRLQAFSANWSPDGRKVVFIGQVPAVDAPPEWEIFTVRRDGSGLTRVTRTHAEEFDPEWARLSGEDGS